MRHTSLLVVLLTAVGLGSLACGDGPSDTDAPDDGGGQDELRFAARAEVAPSTLVDTTWQLDSLLDGDATAPVANAERATLVLDGGRLAGGTGCNRVTGPAEVVEDRLRAGPLASTRMFCEGVMQQEAHVLAVLEGGPAIAIVGDRLTLVLDDGRGLVYRPQPTP
jgi:heat shock protein HslJ